VEETILQVTSIVPILLSSMCDIEFRYLILTGAGKTISCLGRTNFVTKNSMLATLAQRFSFMVVCV
jgi:hypothetical protein